MYKSKIPQAHNQVSVKVALKDTEMKTAEEPTPNLGQTLAWLRKELSEMQIQDQRLLLTLRHLHSVLQELRADSAHWEDARSSGGTSPIRARAGSEGRGCQHVSSRGLAQLLRGEDTRRSSLP
uniref:Chromosome 20 open reading frame 202 n=2 Tax=Propithecus coquereli TaxID=379532 RepID=A0A2K6FQR4_PROCO